MTPGQQSDDPATHVAQVRRPLAEVLIVHGGKAIGGLAARPVHRLFGRCSGTDKVERRAHDAGIPGEERLRLEDRPDLRPGALARCAGELFKFAGRGGEGLGQPCLLAHGVGVPVR